MQVREIMTKDIETIVPSAALIEAARKMKSLNVGVLPVSENGAIVGMLTDRDLVIRGLAEGSDAGSMQVADIMSRDVVHCPSDASVEEAALLMEERQVRRLVVLDNGFPIGIVTLGDLAAKTGSEQLKGETLEAVSQPCSPVR